MANRAGLSKAEADALGFCSVGPMNMVAAAAPLTPAMQFVQEILRDPSLVKQYNAIVQKNMGNPEGDANIEAWLKTEGYIVRLPFHVLFHSSESLGI